MRSLDEPRALTATDPGGMLKALADYAPAFFASFQSATQSLRPLPKPPRLLVLTGMGGSGIVGNLVAAAIRTSAHVPVLVLKEYQLPRFVNAESLVVAISYSGETEETISATLDAQERGARVVTLSSGGRLQQWAQRHERSHLAVPAGLQPRAALPNLFGAALGGLTALGLGPPASELGTRRQLEDFHAGVAPEQPGRNNPAKQWAHLLHDRFPVLYATPEFSSVALRGRCQLNENAKMLARNDELPEGNHNDLVAWDSLSEGSGYFVGFVHGAKEPPELTERVAFFLKVLKRRGVTYLEQAVEGPGPTARLLKALLFVDYVSVYAACLRGVDPTPVPIIGDLKRVLARSGKAPELARRLA